MAEAFARTQQGKLAKVRVSGEPGAGKTAQLRAFAEWVARERPDAMVLAGRCHERESVPYKAFDAAIDALCQELDRLRHDECAALAPRRAFLLPVVFPVLGKVRALAGGTQGQYAADHLTLRSQAFAALREMLHRIAERRPTVLLLDDLQWADAESLDLLDEIVREPDPPPLLVVCASWHGEECPADVRSTLDRAFGDATPVALEPCAARERAAQGLADPAVVSPSARAVLDLVAVAATAIPESVLSVASGLPRRELAEVVDGLRELRFLRLHRGGDDPQYDVHDARVIARLGDRLDAAARAGCHRALAEAFTACGGADPEVRPTTGSSRANAGARSLTPSVPRSKPTASSLSAGPRGSIAGRSRCRRATRTTPRRGARGARSSATPSRTRAATPRPGTPMSRPPRAHPRTRPWAASDSRPRTSFAGVTSSLGSPWPGSSSSASASRSRSRPARCDRSSASACACASADWTTSSGAKPTCQAPTCSCAISSGPSGSR